MEGRQSSRPPADEFVKLADLRDKGTIAAADFEQAKSKLFPGDGLAAS